MYFNFQQNRVSRSVKNRTPKFICKKVVRGRNLQLPIWSLNLRSPKKMKFETASPQILIKLYTLPLCDYNRRPVIF